MSKRLPYFQFEPAEWLAGDIMFCTMQAQGLFTTLKAIYWQKDCDLSLDQAVKRLKNEELFNELISEKIIKIKAGKIKINFLDEQYEKLSEKSKINAKNGALGGRPKKLEKTQKKPNGFDSVIKNETETKALRRDKIKEDNNNIKTIETLDVRKLKFSSTLKPFLEKYGKDLLNDFYLYWTEPNKSKTKFRQELQKTWDLERRLSTWAKNDKNFTTSNLTNNGQSNINISKQQFRFSTSEAIQTISGNSSRGQS